MMEIVEYRPGKWVKVVDGHIVGRATADEVAAWQAQAEESEAADPSPLALDIDLDLDAAPRAGGPGHTLDVPLKPAFERRRAAPKGRKTPAATPTSEDPEDITVEMAIAREAMTHRRARKDAPKEEAPSGPVMVRRRLPQRAAPPAGDEAPKGEVSSSEAEVSKAPTAKSKKTASRRSKPAEAEAPAPAETPEATTARPKKKMASRRRKTAEAEAPAKAAEAAPAEPKKKTSRRRKKAVEAEVAAPSEAPEATAAKKTATRRRKKAAETETPEPEATADRPKRKRRTSSRSKAKKAEAEPAGSPVAEAPPEDEKDRGPSFWWVYNARSQPVNAFLRDWLPKYKVKFGHEATRILCHEDDFAAVQECVADLDVEISSLVQPGHFYFTHGEDSD